MEENKNEDLIEVSSQEDLVRDKKENKIKLVFLKIFDILFKPVIGFIFVFVLFKTVIFHGYIPSPSMENTLMTNSFVIGERVSLVLDKNSIKRYDIIVFKAQMLNGADEHYVKRVIGLPGDKIKITENDILVNGEPTIKDFVSSEDPTQVMDIGEFTVPEDSYFVAGDNRSNSYDSRKWSNKFIKRESVVSKVLFSYRFWEISFPKQYK